MKHRIGAQRTGRKPREGLRAIAQAEAGPSMERGLLLLPPHDLN